MADTATVTKNAPGWADLSTSDAAAARKHYSELFGWDAEVVDDPQAGGYGMFKLDGKQVGGVGPLQAEQQPPAWMMYVIVDDADANAAKAKEAGGQVFAEPFDVMDVGRMAVIADPSGAVFGLWQPKTHHGWEVHDTAGSVGWVELNARGFNQKTKDFYQKVFGWDPTKSEMPGPMEYTEFKLDGKSIAGGMEMVDAVPAEIPSHWLIYFGVDDVDAAAARNKELGGAVLMEPMDFPGGRFAVLGDPQRAAFAVVKVNPPAATS